MTTKPEALLIAELWDDYLPAYNYKQVASDTARELRRLHEENKEMLAVLKRLVAHLAVDADTERMVRAAIKKAEGI
jgi:hypothetical protein